MRILITGGFGFIGGRLAEYLVKAGHNVVLGSSRNETSPPSWLPEAKVVLIKWIDYHELVNNCRGIDILIHAAGMNANDCCSDPVGALEYNGVNTARMVAAACKAGVKRFLYLSTAHVYASPLEGKITEETCPRNLHPYATSHLAGEHAVLSANERGDIQGSVFRLSNAFGYPANKNAKCWMLLTNDLCKQAVITRRLILRSSGLQQRNFIAMSEVCKVTKNFLDLTGSFSTTGVFNVGSCEADTVLTMANLIQERCLHILSYKPELEFQAEDGKINKYALEYRSSRFTKLGISINKKNNIIEIDELLLYCNKIYI